MKVNEEACCPGVRTQVPQEQEKELKQEARSQRKEAESAATCEPNASRSLARVLSAEAMSLLVEFGREQFLTPDLDLYSGKKGLGRFSGCWVLTFEILDGEGQDFSREAARRKLMRLLSLHFCSSFSVPVSLECFPPLGGRWRPHLGGETGFQLSLAASGFQEAWGPQPLATFQAGLLPPEDPLAGNVQLCSRTVIWPASPCFANGIIIIEYCAAIAGSTSAEGPGLLRSTPKPQCRWLAYVGALDYSCLACPPVSRPGWRQPGGGLANKVYSLFLVWVAETFIPGAADQPGRARPDGPSAPAQLPTRLPLPMCEAQDKPFAPLPAPP